jgi:hypothetical protein
MSIDRLSKYLKQQGNKVQLNLGEVVLTNKDWSSGRNGIVLKLLFMVD